MEIPPFPNSVNAPYHGIDQLRDSYRIDQISRNTTKEIAAITKYSEFVYEYRSGEIHTSTLKVSRQDFLDLEVWLWWSLFWLSLSVENPPAKSFSFKNLRLALSTVTRLMRNQLAESISFWATTDFSPLIVQYERYQPQTQALRYCFVTQRKEMMNES